MHYNNCVINISDNKFVFSGNFVIQNRMGKIIPIELITKSDSKAKSLSVFMKKFTVTEAYRVTENNFATKKGVRYIPIYAIFCLNDNRM